MATDRTWHSSIVNFNYYSLPAQVSLLSSRLRSRFENLEIGTVDAFQGRENEVVIVSLVRSNTEVSVPPLAKFHILNLILLRMK